MRDITIVGGGPAGCFTASKLAEQGFEVTILEEHAETGQPMSCAGIVGAEGLKEIGLDPKRWALSELRGANLYTPSGKSIHLTRDKVEAYVINRSKFDRDLAESAVRAGAELLLETKCTDISFKDKGVSLKTRTQESSDREIRTKLVIGADGANSLVARKAGLIEEFNLINCAQIETLADIGENTAEVYFGRKSSPGFFAWIIPAGEAFRVGLGSTEGGAAQKLFKFIRNHPIASQKVGKKHFSLTIGQIPKPKSRKIHGERVILVGDAAGHVKPITGGGLYLGLSCASLAVDVVSQALEDEPSKENLADYEKSVNEEFGREFEFGLRAQNIFREMPDEDLDEVLSLLSKPEIRNLVLEHADFDHHSELFKALIKEGPTLLSSIGARKALKYMARFFKS